MKRVRFSTFNKNSFIKKFLDEREYSKKALRKATKAACIKGKEKKIRRIAFFPHRNLFRLKNGERIKVKFVLK